MGASSSSVGSLNDDELMRVKTSWVPVMENAEANGIFMFKMFLDRHNYYRYFKKFSAIPIQEVSDNKGFQKHALGIMKTIDGVITHLGNDAQLKTELFDLGNFHRTKNVNEQQFKELKAVIMETFEKKFNQPVETLQAWNKAFDIAFGYVYEGLRPKASSSHK